MRSRTSISGVAVAVAVAVLLAGCGGSSRKRSGKAKSRSDDRSTTTGANTRSTTAAPSARPSSPQPCKDGTGWSPEQQAAFLKTSGSVSLVGGAGSAPGAQVRVADPALCKAVPVQLEYWLVTGTPAKLTSVHRQTLTTDARTAQAVPLPAAVTSRDNCAGALAVMYAGAAPLADTEIPRELTQFNRALTGYSARVVSADVRLPAC
jgi:hypothetical protein